MSPLFVTAQERTQKAVRFEIPAYIEELEALRFRPRRITWHSEKTAHALEYILSEFPPPPRSHPENQREALEALICSLYDAWLNKRPLAVPLNWEAYAERIVRYTDSFWNYRTMKRVVDLTKRLGYVLVEKGFKNPETGEGYLTKLYCTQKLIDLFPMQYKAENKEVLLLKNTDGRPMDYEDNSFTRSKRAFICQWNRYIEGFEITLDGSPINPALYAVHSRGKWNLHGRFYGDYQNLPESDRERILIDGQPTSEPDFSAMHLSMIYQLEGLAQPEGDHYLSVCLELGIPENLQDTVRAAVKQLVNTCLNAKTHVAAIQSFYNELNRLRSSILCRPEKRQRAIQIWEAMHSAGINAREILEAIQTVHEPVSNWLCSDAGITLMFYDSEIMRSILSELMNRRIPGLPVHDSIRVPASHELEVEAIMRDSKDCYLRTLKA
ncbi:MAG: hypothetical protein KKC51_02935 [Verrucomicrobia bacterium]|nr:hypothetical protein [Verrucomicrobiota bacterium]